MTHGLRRKDLDGIIAAVEKLPEIETAVIFGSRAKGNFKRASDIDLAIKGSAITDTTVKRLYASLNEESALPYFFDVVHFESIQNDALVEHIIRVGRIVFRRKDKTA